MAALTFNQMATRLNTLLRDTDNFSYTPAEKTEALTSAYEDPNVFIVDIDQSLTTVAAQSTYAVDDAFEDLTEVRYDYYGNGYGTPLTGWDFVNGNLIFESSNTNLAAGKTLWLYGKRKLTINDLVPTYMQAYILHIAAAYAIDLLMADKTQRFLLTDATLPELQNAKANHLQTAERLRKGLNNRRAVRL